MANAESSFAGTGSSARMKAIKESVMSPYGSASAEHELVKGIRL